jgi:hypothetical protein
MALIRTFQRIVLFVGLLCPCCWVTAAEPKGPPENNTFTEPGMFSVKAPEGDFYWKKLGSTKNDRGIATHNFVCGKKSEDGKKGLRTSIQLLVQEVELRDDKQRVEFLEAYKQLFLDRLAKSHFTDIKSTELTTESPLPKRTGFSVSCKLPIGAATFTQTEVVFGKYPFIITSLGSDKAEVGRILKQVADSLKEPKK